MMRSDIILDRGLPTCVDTERLVLGSVLVDPEALVDLEASISGEDFSTAAHRRIWGAMVDLRAKGTAVDRVMLAHELMSRGYLESVGGVAYLGSLDEGLPRVSNLDAYVQMLQRKTSERRLITACHNAILRVYGGDQVEDIAGDLRSLSLPAANKSALRAAGEVIAETGIQRFLSPNDAEPNAIPVPWKSLARIVPLWRPGQLVIIASRPGKGKSVFLAGVVRDAAKHGIGTALFSLEMSSVELLRRMAVGVACVNGHKVTLGKLTEVERHALQAATSEIADAPIWIDDTCGRTVPAIDRALRKLRLQADIGLVAVDYLQLLNATGRRENRTQEISEISRGLKLLAIEHQLPVIVAAQINRAGATEVPDLHHLRDGGSIEADADVVILLHSADKDSSEPVLRTRFIVRKQRGGPVGSCELLFHRAFTKFVEPEVQT